MFSWVSPIDRSDFIFRFSHASVCVNDSSQSWCQREESLVHLHLAEQSARPARARRRHRLCRRSQRTHHVGWATWCSTHGCSQLNETIHPHTFRRVGVFSSAHLDPAPKRPPSRAPWFAGVVPPTGDTPDYRDRGGNSRRSGHLENSSGNTGSNPVRGTKGAGSVVSRLFSF